MALDLDLTAALRGTTDLRRLVEAIVGASDHDEADWVEWKSTLDLATKAGCFHVTRAVLGMANRPPDRALVTCEGLGYVVVGAEPGALAGVESVDPATLDQLTEPYLGGPDGPRSSASYVPVGSKTVLVVTIEAPRPGDRIFSLRKEWDKYTNGTVFVRKYGRTVIADAADLDALQSRLAAPVASGAELEVGIIGDVPLSWIDIASAGEAIEAWVTKQRNGLIARAKNVERQRHPDRFTTENDLLGAGGLRAAAAFAHQQHSLMPQLAAAASRFGIDEEDTRTFDEYLDQVDAWTRRWTKAADGALPRRYIDLGHGVINVQVHNPGRRFLPDVEVQVHFNVDTALSFDKRPGPMELPKPPRAYGERTPHAGLTAVPYLSPHVAVPNLEGIRDVVGRRTWVEKGSIVVRFGIGDLRQHDTDTSDDVYVILRERPDDGVLRGTWKATIRDVDGVMAGTVDVPIAEEAVDITVLLDDAANQNKD